MSEQQTSQTKNPKSPRIAFASLACFILTILLGNTNELKALNFLVILALAGAALAVIAIFQAIIRRCKPLQYTLPAISLILCISVIPPVLLTIGHNNHVSKIKHCGFNLNFLSLAILWPTNDQLPDPNQWCDLLVNDANLPEELFICKQSGAKPGQSSYALNKYLIGIGNNFKSLPDDTVIAFEAKLTPNSWNQTAGPNDIAIENHKEGINVLFKNFKVKFIKPEDIPKLNWNPEH